jgi:hypothetical protein
MNQKREKFDEKAADKILQCNQKISSSKLHCSTTLKQKKKEIYRSNIGNKLITFFGIKKAIQF